MTRYYLDSEFIDDGKTIELISIGIVCEDGREFYAENANVDLTKANDWVKENVIPHLWHKQENQAYANTWSLKGNVGGYWNKAKIANAVKDFINPSLYGSSEIWTYYGSYDWVIFCQLHGKMIDLPYDFPMYTMDIKQWCKQLGDPELPRQIGTEHNALDDARHNQVMFNFLNNLG